jgi:cupin fold WbuC family metalloprotein
MSLPPPLMPNFARHLDAIARRTSTEVFHANKWGVSWGREIIEELKEVALRSDRSRARLCLHPNPSDAHQEMLIVMARSAVELPQRRTLGFDTKIVIEGQATLRYYSPEGSQIRGVRLGGEASIYVHTGSSEYHSLLVESDWFVFLEILKGPFDASTTEFAPWALVEGDSKNCERSSSSYLRVHARWNLRGAWRSSLIPIFL